MPGGERRSRRPAFERARSHTRGFMRSRPDTPLESSEVASNSRPAFGPRPSSSTGEGDKWLARWARCCAIHLHLRLGRDFLGGVEFLGDVRSGTKVHLVGRLTAERRVGETRIVLVHIERDQLLESADRVERVQEQPCRAGYCLPQALSDHSPGLSGISIGANPRPGRAGPPGPHVSMQTRRRPSQRAGTASFAAHDIPVFVGALVNVIAQAEPIGRQAGYASSSRMRCSQYRGCHTPRRML